MFAGGHAQLFAPFHYFSLLFMAVALVSGRCLRRENAEEQMAGHERTELEVAEAAHRLEVKSLDLSLGVCHSQRRAGRSP